MDKDLKNLITNTLVEGLFFVEKIGEKLLNDELNIEHRGIIKSFSKLLSILEKTQPLCSDLKSTQSLPVTDHNEKWSIKAKNEVTNRKPEALPLMESPDGYLILEEKQACFTMQSDLPSYRYIRLCISVNNNFKGMYYCVLEKTVILFGLELNNLPPEYVIPLENNEISEEMGTVITVKNINNGLEIAMQFELESECKSWLKSILNAQASIYTYIPIRLQEKGNNSPPETAPHSPPVVIEPPQLPPKLSDLKKTNLKTGRISKSRSCFNIEDEIEHSVYSNESNHSIENAYVAMSSVANFPNDSSFVMQNSLKPIARERPLPPPPLNKSRSFSNQQSDVNEYVLNMSDEFNLENTDFIETDSLKLNKFGYRVHNIVQPPKMKRPGPVPNVVPKSAVRSVQENKNKTKQTRGISESNPLKP